LRIKNINKNNLFNFLISMKRTRETIFREHPDWMARDGVSGCKEFDGEDLCKYLAFYNYLKRI
jgi:hypothetical protein